jgi:hypothetical protein
MVSTVGLSAWRPGDLSHIEIYPCGVLSLNTKTRHLELFISLQRKGTRSSSGGGVFYYSSTCREPHHTIAQTLFFARPTLNRNT